MAPRTALVAAAALLLAAGCGRAPEPSPGAAPGQSAPAGNGGGLRVEDKGGPEITAQKVSRDVVGWVVQVADVNGVRPGTQWTFEADEYRRIDILERRVTDGGVDVLVFMLTRSRPGEDDVQVAGQLRLHYAQQGRQWKLRKIQNVSFRYSLGVAT